MTLIVPKQGEQIALEALVNKTATEVLKLCLFTNNYTPVNTTTEADMTEASGSGYAEISLTAASWTWHTGNPSYIDFAEQTFTFTGALGNVYGYYLKQTSSGKLVWAERFSDGPYNVSTNGDKVFVTPKITLE